LYERYAQELHVLAERQTSAALKSRVDADDIVQSVFRTFFRRITTTTYDAPDGEDLWRLFLVIALNKIRNAGTKHGAAKRDVRRTQSLESIAANSACGGDETSATILNLVVEESIEAMPESSRDLIRQRLEGHDIQSIAAQSGRSKRSVERVLQTYREYLKAILDEDYSPHCESGPSGRTD
jgi:RNA polymerase sigma-70 factor, ECF subfamily